MNKPTKILLVAVMVLASCGGTDDVEVSFPEEYPAPAKALELPEPPAAVPAYLALLERPVSDRLVARLQRNPAIVVATPVGIGRVSVLAPEGPSRVRVAAVEPLGFRAVAPEPSREAGFVWSALIAGHVVTTPEAARRLGVEDEARLDIGDWKPLRIGAFADNASPNIADVLVDVRVGRKLGVKDRSMLMVGAAPGASIDALGAFLERELTARGLRRLIPQVPELFAPEDPEPSGEAQGGLIGRMRFKLRKDGFIEPDPAWVAANIATATVPLLGEVTCHRLMLPQMAQALAQVEEEGLGHLIDPGDYGGCYVPRFIGRDPSRALSMHAFGLAFDLNVSENYEGAPGKMDPRVVAIMESWGFRWGGRWSPPDPMHFELAELRSAARSG